MQEEEIEIQAVMKGMKVLEVRRIDLDKQSEVSLKKIRLIQ